MDEIDREITSWERTLSVWTCASPIKEAFQECIDQLKKCRRENKALRIVNETLDNFNKAIEQRTREACFKAGWKALISCGAKSVLFNIEDAEETFRKAIYGAKIE